MKTLPLLILAALLTACSPSAEADGSGATSSASTSSPTMAPAPPAAAPSVAGGGSLANPVPPAGDAGK